MMYDKLKDNPDWFVELLDCEQTLRNNGTRIFTDEMIQMERDSGMSEERIAQEYYCSFAAGVVGNYYGREMEKARDEGRVGKVRHDPRLPVHTYWDIGIDDATAVWFGQRRHFERRWFRYEEWTDTPLLEIYHELLTYNYRYAYHNFPHDARQRNKDTGIRTIEYANDVFDGNGDVVVTPLHSVEDGIESTRYLIGQSWFDAEGCKRGIDALMNYRKIWDEKRMSYQLKPYHDWSSHGADAFRQAGWQDADEPIIENVFEYASSNRKVQVNRSF